MSIPDVYLLYRGFMQAFVLPPAFILGVIILPLKMYWGLEVPSYSFWGDNIVEHVNLLEFTEDVSKVSLERAESVKSEAEPVYNSPIDSVEKKYEKTPAHSIGAVMLAFTVGIAYIVITEFITGR